MSKICKNCEEPVQQNFCSNCGQKTKVDRINLSNLVSDLMEDVFQLNRGLFFTIRELFIRPGEMITGFLEGHRKNYFKPIAYAIVLSTFYYLVSKAAGGVTFLNDFMEGMSEGASQE